MKRTTEDIEKELINELRGCNQPILISKLSYRLGYAYHRTKTLVLKLEEEGTVKVHRVHKPSQIWSYVNLVKGEP